jgi:hypothetical protein
MAGTLRIEMLREHDRSGKVLIECANECRERSDAAGGRAYNYQIAFLLRV